MKEQSLSGILGRLMNLFRFGVIAHPDHLAVLQIEDVLEPRRTGRPIDARPYARPRS
jgi:hypothetical protein